MKALNIYLKRYFKQDLSASIVVFLIAIPLCLGVAMAANAPIISGLISGIIGGIVVGYLSQSNLSVSGPSAAIAAVIINAIAYFHNYETVLLCLFISGLLQIISGFKGYGFIADYIPSNVIQGMMCGIGIILVTKQIPIAFTLFKNYAEIKYALIDAADSVLVHPLIHLGFHVNSGGILLSLLSLAILYYLDQNKHPFTRFLPAPIIVVILGSLINWWFIKQHSIFAQHAPQLVNLPHFENMLDLWQALPSPNWAAWQNPQVYIYALILYAITTLETLLNLNATEKVDPRRQTIDKNRELYAQGIGNMLGSVLGSIPISSVIVRTSVNIEAGAKSKVSSILHGTLLLVTIFFIPFILNVIPLCLLSSILMYTGYKLSKPSIYRQVYLQGFNRFLPFITTVLSIVFFNLVIGIVLGLLIHLFFILRNNSTARIDLVREVYPGSINFRLLLPQQTTFLNKASIVAELSGIPNEINLTIDARHTKFIDKELIEYLHEFKAHIAPLRKINLNLEGFKDVYEINDHINFINVTSYDAQSNLSPNEVLEILKQGNERFLNEQDFHRTNLVNVQFTAATQHPIACVLGCIDSRVPVETIFDMTLGDLFCARVAGNIINDDILASIEYACHVVGAKLIVILGHSACGAIQAACNHVEKGHITGLLEKIKPAIAAENSIQDERTGSNQAFVQEVAKLNIAHSMLEIYERSPILRTMLDEKQIGMIGGIYDVATGSVYFSNFHKEILKFGPSKIPSM